MVSVSQAPKGIAREAYKGLVGGVGGAIGGVKSGASAAGQLGRFLWGAARGGSDDASRAIPKNTPYIPPTPKAPPVLKTPQSLAAPAVDDVVRGAGPSATTPPLAGRQQFLDASSKKWIVKSTVIGGSTAAAGLGIAYGGQKVGDGLAALGGGAKDFLTDVGTGAGAGAGAAFGGAAAGAGAGFGAGFRDLFGGIGLGTGEGAAAGLGGIAEGLKRIAFPAILIGGGVLVFLLAQSQVPRRR